MEADDEDFDPEGGNVADEAEQVRVLVRHARPNNVQIGMVGLESTVSAVQLSRRGVRSHPLPAFSPGCCWCRNQPRPWLEQLKALNMRPLPVARHDVLLIHSPNAVPMRLVRREQAAAAADEEAADDDADEPEDDEEVEEDEVRHVDFPSLTVRHIVIPCVSLAFATLLYLLLHVQCDEAMHPARC